MSTSQYSQRALYTIKTFGKDEMFTGNDNPWAVHVGCMGCGKTRSLTEAFGYYCASLQAYGLHGLNFILLGRTQGAAKKNMGNVLANLFGNDFAYDKSVADGITKDATCFGQNIYFVGLSDSSSESKIRGISDIMGILHDEAVFCTEDQFDLIMARLRGATNIELPPGYTYNWYIGSTNPDGPSHWLKKKIDRGEIKCIQWYARDAKWKGFLKYFEGRKRLYRRNKPMWMKYIQGLWAQAEGVVFKSFRRDTNILQMDSDDIDLKQFKRVWFSIDVGSTHPTAILLLGRTYDNRRVVIKEWKYQHTALSTIVVENLDVYDYICRLLGKESLVIYYDPAAEAIYDEYRKFGITPLKAKKDVQAGIEYVDGQYAQDKLLLSRSCTTTIEQMDTYAYKESNGTEGKVIKVNDDFADALRYGVYSDYIYNIDEEKE